MGWFGGSEEHESTPSSSSFDSGYSKDDFGSTNFASSSGSGYDSGFGSGSPDLSGGAGKSADPELQSFLMLEQQKAQFQSMVHKMNDVCWDTCVGTPDSKLSSRTETCVSNCVDRFIDSTLYITNRFAQLLSKQG